MNQDTFDQLTQQSEATISAKVICDSVNPDGCRLTTMEWTYPRFIHSEIMTHRKLSRNAASSRAIPLAKMIECVSTNPVFPLHWGRNEKGMQASAELDVGQKLAAADTWLRARELSVISAECLERVGIHKQIGNRLLEPWMWITIVVSATNFENLFGLRCHKDAEPHFQNLAYKVRSAYDASKPKTLRWREWHLPYFANNGGGGDADVLFCIKESELIHNQPLHFAPQLSAARCGRISYLTQDKRRDCYEDINLYRRLAGQLPLHASPLEHPAQAVTPLDWISRTEGPRHDWGNFDPGWLQFRKMHENENIIKRV